MSATVEVIEEFIRNQIAKPTANTTIVRSWWRYANESGYFNMPSYHAPGFCRNAKLAGKNINEEFGFDVIKMHFYGIWKNNETKNSLPWEKDHSISYSHPITCLLYTSPSPRDRQKSRMPSSA